MKIKLTFITPKKQNINTTIDVDAIQNFQDIILEDHINEILATATNLGPIRHAQTVVATNKEILSDDSRVFNLQEPKMVYLVEEV